MSLDVTDLDERLHPVEDGSEHWSDSLYFNAWDPASGYSTVAPNPRTNLSDAVLAAHARPPR